MSNRGFLYVVWGEQYHGLLDRSVSSVKQFYPDSQVKIVSLPDHASLFDKARMYQFSECETTVYLDVDTVLMEPIDFVFEKAEQWGIACCICECPWGTRYPGIEKETVEYNTGVIGFHKCRRVESVFAEWHRQTKLIDSSVEFFVGDHEKTTMPLNDQAAFAYAMQAERFNPFVLPMNYNLRPIWQKRWFGSVKIWHDYQDPPKGCANRGPMELFAIE